MFGMNHTECNIERAVKYCDELSIWSLSFFSFKLSKPGNVVDYDQWFSNGGTIQGVRERK